MTIESIAAGNELMTQEEAEAAAAVIKEETKKLVRNLAYLRALAMDFDERKGWEALGYGSIEACARNEFGWTSRQFFRQLAAGKYEKDAGIPVGSMPERAIRRIITKPQQTTTQGRESLPDDCETRNKPPEAQRQAFAEAKKDGAPTAEKVRRAVERIEQPAPEPEPEPEPSFGGITDQFGDEEKEELCRPFPGEDAAAPSEMDEEWTVGEIDRVFFEKRGMSLADVLRVARAVVETAEDEEAGNNRRMAARACLKRA